MGLMLCFGILVKLSASYFTNNLKKKLQLKYLFVNNKGLKGTDVSLCQSKTPWGILAISCPRGSCAPFPSHWGIHLKQAARLNESDLSLLCLVLF